MNTEEYANLARIEEDHWYYAGKREIVRGWFRRIKRPGSGEMLLDCGAGTGRFAKEMEAYCRVLVLDDHEESLQRLRALFQPHQVLTLKGDRVPLEDNTLDYITALDVLEHTSDDRAAVWEFNRLLKPGAIAVVTVPAGMALWSDWDEALHHFRRYSRSQLTDLFPAEHWDIVHVNYTNVFVYPLVLCIRKWRKIFPPASGSMRSEDRVPVSWLNAILRNMFVVTGLCAVPFPFGVSLILVARKRDPLR